MLFSRKANRRLTPRFATLVHDPVAVLCIFSLPPLVVVAWLLELVARHHELRAALDHADYSFIDFASVPGVREKASRRPTA